MNILFVTYGELSLGSGSVRPAAILRALAEAGHRIDVVARQADFPAHPNIRFLAGEEGKSAGRFHLRMAVAKAMRRGKYDVVHAVDEALFFASRIARLRKTKLVYDACRTFTGSGGTLPTGLWWLFPGYCKKSEQRALRKAALVLTPCATLVSDLQSLAKGVAPTQIEDVPVQSMYSSREVDRGGLLSRFGTAATSVVVCSVLPGSRREVRNLLMGIRKVLEAVPGAVFFFKGGVSSEAAGMVANLDIVGNCAFFGHEEMEGFVSALDIADAVLLFGRQDDRHIRNEVYTLLNAPAPLVAVQCSAYAHLLNEQNSIQVLGSSESIAEGLLRAIREPLFSLGIATEGQQLVADKYTFSSFKHKVRMAYHGVMKPA